MLKQIAVKTIKSYGFTQEKAELALDEIKKQAPLEDIYSIKVVSKDDNIIFKVEATKLSRDEFIKAALINYFTNYVEEHRDLMVKDPAKLSRMLKRKMYMLQIDACRDILAEE